LRTLAPGWIGIANIKWVGRIFVSEEAIFVEKNTNEYILIGPDFLEQAPPSSRAMFPLGQAPQKGCC
jgi:DMSO/TMAO reductase YedYZ molybdopterin-dependent catalytic subunit